MIKVSTYKCLSRFIIIIIIIFPTFCHGCFPSRSSVCRVKACLLQRHSLGYAVFVFVAATRNDRAPQCSMPVPLVVSLSHRLRKKKKEKEETVSLMPLPHDTYMLTYVYVCVSVSIHMFRNMCMGAKTFIILHGYSVLYLGLFESLISYVFFA